ncbi:D-alanyl-D-alanine carboxypeptidase family protein [Neisseria perflava]|uniref:D-alanyl-D-alanine carboxypeptidase family protein n=1 Tax=Neisseria perflava TaxID=33053 RepID=UPI00209D0CD0|nr:D-alanyl-D-alanine carboxypeptidase family protein [Neisseria perflava]MCP1659625.1 D-alanyl-D-alanine carboxypeptidase (penicillin-binding protein 5/6) [Neisseria perflava]
MKKTLLSLTLASLLAGQSVTAAPQKTASAPQNPASAAASEPANQAASAVQPETLMPGINSPTTPPDIAATAYIVKDLYSNQVLASNSADTPIEPASLTKMMTAYLAFKALDNGTLKADQMLTVSDVGWKVEGSRMFLNPKIPVSVSDLIKGMVVQSGNDAAITLAEAMGNGSVDEFVKQMNEEAKQLGMSKTHFNNPTGLTSGGHVSTVTDMATLASALIKDYPKYYPVFSIKSFKYNGIEQPNRNLLLFRDSNVDGLKTGHTESAGYNLAASSKRNGRRIVSVVVGTESTEARASESSKLLNWALQAFDTPKLYNAGEAISQVKVYKGSSNAVNIGFNDVTYVTIPHDSGNSIKPILETVQPVLAPIQKGQVLGKLKIMKGNEVLAEKDVVALNAVDEANWFGRTWDSIVLWFKTTFGSSVSEKPAAGKPAAQDKKTTPQVQKTTQATAASSEQTQTPPQPAASAPQK